MAADTPLDKPTGAEQVAVQTVLSQRPEPWRLLVAGAVAGAASRTVTAPLDRVKLVMQGHIPGSKPGHPSHGPSGTTLLGVVQAIWKERGILAFWRGNGANVVKIAPESALKLTSNDMLRSTIVGDPSHPTVGERFMCGSISGAVSQGAIFPLELTKMRLAVTAPNTYTGIWHCLTTVVRDEGPLALYKGLFPSLVGIMPYAGVELMTYSLLRDLYIERHGGEKPGIVPVLLCGAVASTAGQSVAYPLSLVRTRICQQGAPGRPVLYDGMVDCIRKIIAADGFRGLYRGMSVSWMKAVPSVAITFVVFERVKIWLQDIP